VISIIAQTPVDGSKTFQSIVGRVPSADDIKQRIEAAIPGAHAEVEDYTGGGDHFRASVTAAAFEGRSRIEQHRLVYDVFGAEIGAAIHALALKTQTPSKAPTH
jgi:stress-induced morphogen